MRKMMSTTYKSRKKKQFTADSKEPIKLSRAKIELFFDCQRCFYFDVKLGVSRPPMLPFTLNNAVDQLLKNEFDYFRKKNEPHPLLIHHGIQAKLFDHPKLDEWRENFKGITYHHEKTNFLITGAVDDLWINDDLELLIVDYKATAKDNPITRPDELYSAYKRQMEVYKWLYEKNGFKVAKDGVFVYCNGLKNKPVFKRHLEFSVHIVFYQATTNWIENKLEEIHKTLMDETIPNGSDCCEYCKYAKAIHGLSF
jgi:hypothetical protein